ncbi:MAG TPA: hypothetical protein VGQ37_05630 [Vicinamibacterales bacterium]|jgi:hypothetical protein|nr:hypothetical protein [Vicinamibacterales bacterium]
MTPPPGPVVCLQPIDASALMDYWLGLLSPDAEETLEAHLLACDACGDRLRSTIALTESLRTLARSGSLQVVVSERMVKQAEHQGHRVRQYATQPGESVQCTVAADDDFLIARLAADVSRAPRVDLSWCDAQGAEWRRMADIPVRADAGEVLCQWAITIAKASPSNTMVARLLAVDEQGESLLGEYTFHHTRTIAGPGTWPPS